MKWLTNLVEPLAENYGGLGLAVVAFLDSSFLSLPEVNDVAIVLLVISHPERWFYYAAVTTAGSIAGCYALYLIARKGGDAFLRRRMSGARLERGVATFQKYGMLAIIVPSILPPPMPFKIFVLLAGVARVSPGKFLTAVAIGRGFRYGGEALLAYKYGEQAVELIHRNLAIVSVILAVAVAVGGIAFVLWRRRRAA